MKKQNEKQKLFENMVKINPDLKNNTCLNNILNESAAPKLNEEFGAGTDDPTKEEMVGFLTQQFQGFLDPQEVDGNNFDMESAIYWFANDYHGGQSSNLYSVLSTSDYRPSQMERSIADLEDGTATMMYQELVSKYGGNATPIDAGNSQWQGIEMNEYEVQSSNVELKMKDGKTIPIKLQDHGRNIIVGDNTIDEILDSVGQEFAIGNFKQQVTLNQYFDYLQNRQGGATEETFNNNRLFRVNLEHAVELFNRFSVEDGYDEPMQENISIDVEVGDTIMTGRFKNKRTVVKSIGKDEHGMPTINGKKVVTFKKGIAKDESVNETVDTWENNIAPSNQEHFAKQAQGLGVSPQEMYDEMKSQETEDDARMSLNEAELSREDMMAALKAKFGLSHVDTTENFYQDSTEDVAEGGIWLSGENGETARDGRDLFDYYSTDYKNYDLGVHNELNKFLEDNGWYAEWNDPGTLMVMNDSMNEGEEVQGLESTDSSKKFVVVANQNYRGWSKKKGYMKTITTPTHDNSEYVLSDEISQEEARRMVDSIEGDEQWKNSGIVVYMVSADEIGDKPRPTRRRDPDEWMDYINEHKDYINSGTSVKFRAEVTGKGENRWSGNAMEYDTEEEAKEWLDNLSNRWFGYDMGRVVPMTVPTGQQVDMENDIIYQNFRN